MFAAQSSPAIEPPELHPNGWYRSPTALCDTHRPLDYLHIQGIGNCQARALGLIPTRTLIVTSMSTGILVQEMTQDPHLFPGMRLLRISQRMNCRYIWNPIMTNDYLIPGKFDFSQMLAVRDIEITDDAEEITLLNVLHQGQ